MEIISFVFPLAAVVNSAEGKVTFNGLSVEI